MHHALARLAITRLQPVGELQSDRSDAATGVRSLLPMYFAILWVAALDFGWQRTNVSILYAIPMLLFARSGSTRHLGRIVTLLIALTYAAYLFKKATDPLGASTPYLHFSLLNRTLVAVMLAASAWVMWLWNRWREQEDDPELPTTLRLQDREISSTLAILTCIPMVTVIGAFDIAAPANYNIAILYGIPLFVCVWTGSRKLLWGVLVTLVLLAAIAHLFGPPATDPSSVFTVGRNRFVALVGLAALTGVLHYTIAHDMRDEAA